MDFNGNGQYQSMEGYGMSPSEAQCPEVYQGYGQMNQGYEEPQAYGNGQQWGSDEQRGCQSGSASYGGPGYRSPLRYNRILKEMNSRNGLYSPTEQRSNGGNAGNGGDYYNSLPGIGGAEGQMAYRGGDSQRNQWY